jgi:hypothetical protein
MYLLLLITGDLISFLVQYRKLIVWRTFLYSTTFLLITIQVKIGSGASLRFFLYLKVHPLIHFISIWEDSLKESLDSRHMFPMMIRMEESFNSQLVIPWLMCFVWDGKKCQGKGKVLTRKGGQLLLSNNFHLLHCHCSLSLFRFLYPDGACSSYWFFFTWPTIPYFTTILLSLKMHLFAFLQNTETRLGGAEERIKERIYALWGTVDTGSDETNKK